MLVATAANKPPLMVTATEDFRCCLASIQGYLQILAKIAAHLCYVTQIQQRAKKASKHSIMTFNRELYIKTCEKAV